MTIICALYDDNADELWLGCNDRATIGDSPAPSSASKWVFMHDWGIAISGDEAVYEQFLQLAADDFPKETRAVLDIFEFMRSTFDHYNLNQQKDRGSCPTYGIDGLIVHASGRIWDYDSQLALSEVQPGRLWACGSGADYALGADFVMAGSGIAPRERVTWAVNAAIALDIGCPGEPLVERFPER